MVTRVWDLSQLHTKLTCCCQIVTLFLNLDGKNMLKYFPCNVETLGTEHSNYK